MRHIYTHPAAVNLPATLLSSYIWWRIPMRATSRGAFVCEDVCVRVRSVGSRLRSGAHTEEKSKEFSAEG